MVPNNLLPNISSDQAAADGWVRTNVAAFYPATKIRYVLVGNEILSPWNDDSIWPHLVPAMRRIRSALKKSGLAKIKVGTPVAVDAVDSIFPPSNGTFRRNISDIMVDMLRFHKKTKSVFFVDLYTYFPWVDKFKKINLDFALLQPGNVTYTDPGSGLRYNNLLDVMIDSLIYAMKRVGFPDIPLFLAETGWPNGGDIDQIGANIHNAATYNRNVVKKFTAQPPIGTPLRPGVIIPALIFALYNENQKWGPGTERHFGLLYPNGTNVYNIDLSGQTSESTYEPLPEPTNNEPYKGKIWCVVALTANQTQLAAAVDEACKQGNRTCKAIRPGGKCYKPYLTILHANYAFSSYWARFRKSGAYCYFNGLAVQTTKNPSKFSDF